MDSLKFQVGTMKFLGMERQFSIANQEKAITHTFEYKDQLVSLVLDVHFFGLTTIASPTSKQDVLLDIVAVTGLAGHALGSWKERGGDFYEQLEKIRWNPSAL
ncbi:hypothetical protein BDY21DRAFT_365519 [Lineolata rhizophorae]|uniref:Uncharacterized protein n=1 Tax=Lineolata rhizophorae TaxID=578093 RepID=A0A6A6NU85_9PEZI|nr:hypothetical protein BDY21DRAFT_365519 [Lineolata rhizophorae]